METNETIVVVKREKVFYGFAMSMKVWIDDKEAAKSIKNGQQVQITVPNGEHTIRAGTSGVDKGKGVTFNAAGEKVFFKASPQMGVVSTRFKIVQTDTLDDVDVSVEYPEPVFDSGNPEAYFRSVEDQMRSIKQRLLESGKTGDSSLVPELRRILGTKNRELNLKIKEWQNQTGQHYQRTVSAWSRGGPNWTVSVTAAIVVFVAGILLETLPGNLIGVVAALVGLSGYVLGRWIPVYNNGLKKLNVFLTILISIVMGYAIFLGSSFIPGVRPMSIEFKVCAFLVAPLVISFIIVRNKVKPLIIVFSILTAASIIGIVFAFTGIAG